MSSSPFPLATEVTANVLDAKDSLIVHFHWSDYVVLVVMLGLSLAIGLYFALVGGQQKTTAEYFKGSSNMPMIPVVLSIMASFLSSNSMLGIPAEVYLHGINYWFTNLGSILGIPISGYFFLPVFYDLKITSVFEYLERRFDRKIRMCGSALSIITMLVHSSFVTYGPALALSQVTGLHLWGSILTTTVIGSVYTSLGGIKAVIWCDSAQFIVFTLALLVAIIKGIIDVDGFSYIISKASEGQRLEPLSFSFDPRLRFTFWGFMIGKTLSWIKGYGLSQIQIQRYQASSTKERAQKSLWYNYPGMIVVHTLYCFIGLMIYVKYWNCDPMSSQQIQHADQIFPLFVMQIMKNLPSLPGLFVAGVYSASLSTISSELNSLAAVTLEDFIRPFWKNLTDEKATKISKYLALGYGAVCLLIVAGIINLGSIVQTTNYLIGGSNGANLGLFTLGLMVPWSNVEGTILGTCCGLAVGWWISMGNLINKPITETLPISTVGCNSTLLHWTAKIPSQRSGNVAEIYKISYMWIIPFSWIVTVIVGCVASKLIGKQRNIDPLLFSPPIRRLLEKYRNFKSRKNDEKTSQTTYLPQEIKDGSYIPMLLKEIKTNSEIKAMTGETLHDVSSLPS